MEENDLTYSSCKQINANGWGRKWKSKNIFCQVDYNTSIKVIVLHKQSSILHCTLEHRNSIWRQPDKIPNKEINFISCSSFFSWPKATWTRKCLSNLCVPSHDLGKSGQELWQERKQRKVCVLTPFRNLDRDITYTVLAHLPRVGISRLRIISPTLISHNMDSIYNHGLINGGDSSAGIMPLRRYLKLSTDNC